MLMRPAAAALRRQAAASQRRGASEALTGEGKTKVRPVGVDPRLLENNLQWRDGKLKQDPDFFNKMAQGQQPEYLWFGCADSRVPANEIIGADCGAVFVHRNIANVVHGNDMSAMAVLQFAVEVLKVKHIIVCGHYDCGGVRAAEKHQAMDPPLDNWLRNIRDVHRYHRKELARITDPEERHRRLVELNVRESCLNLFKTRAVQRRRVATHMEGKPFAEPRIHAMVFDHTTGVLKDLEIDWKLFLAHYAPIYQLFEVPGGEQARPQD